jgi:hypothetical protein
MRTGDQHDLCGLEDQQILILDRSWPSIVQHLEHLQTLLLTKPHSAHAIMRNTEVLRGAAQSVRGIARRTRVLPASAWPRPRPAKVMVPPTPFPRLVAAGEITDAEFDAARRRDIEHCRQAHAPRCVAWLEAHPHRTAV